MEFKKEDSIVSICIPTYNGAKYIKEAFLSAINQSYRPIEIIISDDNSTDDTLKIIREIDKPADIAVKIFSHTPSGIGANWNNCIQHASGNYIKFLFQDDTLVPQCVEKFMNVILAHPNVDFIFSKRKVFTDSNSSLPSDWLSTYANVHSHWNQLKPIQNGRDLLKDKNFLNVPNNKVGEPITVLFKKELFIKSGPFSVTLKQALDYEMWYKMFKYCDVAFIDEELCSFRIHNSQATSINNVNQVREYQKFERIILASCFWHLRFIDQLRVIKNITFKFLKIY